jgi:OmpA-OmpF porin, OOP family
MSFQRLHRIIGALGAVAALSYGASPAAANVEIGATAGPHIFNEANELGVEDRADATSLRNSVLFGLRLGITFNDMLGVEAELGVIPSEGRDLVFDVWALTYRAHLIAQFRAADPAAKLLPFVVAGAGAMQVVSSAKTEPPAGIMKDTDPMFYLGVGAKYRVENNWGLRLDARAIGVPSSKVDSAGQSDNAPVLDYELLLSVYKEWGRTAAPREATDDDLPVTSDDRDGDGIPNDVDQCPDEPEDFDGFQDEDGCPDPDNDGDGIPDASDKCPNEPEDFDGFEDEDGCPDPDNDGDGVPDAQDQCPDQMETHNGYQDDDGCPDEVPRAVQRFTGVIKGINFKTNEAEILKNSFRTLDGAVKVLKEYPDLRMEIQGHTDDVGDDDANMDLSQRRAESVKAYFVDKGIEENRLIARGYGKTQPLVAKTTKAARAKNRRVEFKLVSSLDAPATE